jgi:hypothetical protein
MPSRGCGSLAEGQNDLLSQAAPFAVRGGALGARPLRRFRRRNRLTFPNRGLGLLWLHFLWDGRVTVPGLA